MSEPRPPSCASPDLIRGLTPASILLRTDRVANNCKNRSPHEPTGRRQAPPDDRLRDMRVVLGGGRARISLRSSGLRLLPRPLDVERVGYPKPDRQLIGGAPLRNERRACHVASEPFELDEDMSRPPRRPQVARLRAGSHRDRMPPLASNIGRPDAADCAASMLK